MTKKVIIRFAPLVLTALLLLTTIVITITLPNSRSSDFISYAASSALHG